MSQINLNPENKAVDPTPDAAKDDDSAKTPEAIATKGQTEMSSVWTGRDRVPSDWSIVPAEGEDMIEASNSSTGCVFNGTMAEFNKKLRG